MKTQPDTVSTWRARLEESEELLSSGSQRFRWLRRIYIRVYRFLLSSYGDADQQRDPGNLAPASPACDAANDRPLFDNVPTLDGGEPKSARRIRETLDRVHDAAEQPSSSGPLTKGLDNDAWIVVASETAHISPVRCRELLLKNGIGARVVRRGDDRLVEVRLDDRNEAFDLIQRNRSELRTITRRRRSRMWGALFGAFFGASLFAVLGLTGAVALVAPFGAQQMMTLALTGGGFGALAGWVVGIPTIRRT